MHASQVYVVRSFSGFTQPVQSGVDHLTPVDDQTTDDTNITSPTTKLQQMMTKPSSHCNTVTSHCTKQCANHEHGQHNDDLSSHQTILPVTDLTREYVRPTSHQTVPKTTWRPSKKQSPMMMIVDSLVVHPSLGQIAFDGRCSCVGESCR